MNIIRKLSQVNLRNSDRGVSFRNSDPIDEVRPDEIRQVSIMIDKIGFDKIMKAPGQAITIDGITFRYVMGAIYRFNKNPPLNTVFVDPLTVGKTVVIPTNIPDILQHAVDKLNGKSMSQLISPSNTREKIKRAATQTMINYKNKNFLNEISTHNN